MGNGRSIVARGHRVLGGTTTLDLRLTRSARAKLLRHGLKLTTVAVARDHQGHAATAGFVGVLRRILVPRH